MLLLSIYYYSRRPGGNPEHQPRRWRWQPKHVQRRPEEAWIDLIGGLNVYLVTHPIRSAAHREINRECRHRRAAAAVLAIGKSNRVAVFFSVFVDDVFDVFLFV